MNDNTLKICLYSEFGKGKTLQAGHLIDLVGADNVFICSADKGLRTIASKINPDNVVTPTRFNPPFTPTDEAWLDVRSAYEPMAKWAKAHPTGWMVVDGATAIHNWIKNEQMAGCEAYWNARCLDQVITGPLKIFSRFCNKDGEVDGQRVYEKVGRDTEGFLAALRALPCNLYVNYLEDMTKVSGREKLPPWGPDVPGKVGLDAVMSTFDIVGRLWFESCGAQKCKRCAESGKHLVAGFDSGSNQYMARVREDYESGVRIPLKVVDADLGHFHLGRFVQKIAPKPKAVSADQVIDRG